MSPVQPSPPPIAKLELYLGKGPEGIPLAPGSRLTMEIGETRPLTSVVLDVHQQRQPAVPVLWTSDSPSVAMIDPQGILTAVAPGEATITASANGHSASVRVSVRMPPIVRLAIRSPTTTMTVGETLQLDLLAIDAKNQTHQPITAAWQSDNRHVAQISQSGLVTAVEPGVVTLTATVLGRTATLQMTVVRPPLAQLESQPSTATIPGDGTKRFETIEAHPKEEPPQATAPPAPSQPKEDLKAKYKDIDPSELIYLSGITGEMAGKGDPFGFADEAEQAGRSEHPPALEQANLPKDRYGLVDWAAAIKTGRVKPRHSIDPVPPPEEPPLDLDVVIFTKSKTQPDVIFPHKVHTMWLACENCHDAIFKRKAGGHPEMTMPKIAAGQYCGRCHNRVAFPLSDCQRCHVKPKDQPPLDPNPLFRPTIASPSRSP